MFDVAWAPRVPMGHTAFSWRWPASASLQATASAGSASASASGAGAGAVKVGKRAEKTAAKQAALKEKEAGECGQSEKRSEPPNENLSSCDAM